MLNSDLCIHVCTHLHTRDHEKTHREKQIGGCGCTGASLSVQLLEDKESQRPGTG